MINLLPPEVKANVRFAKYNVTVLQYIIVVVLAVFIVISLMLFGRLTLTSTKEDIEKVVASDRERIAELASVNEVAGSFAGKIDTIGTILDNEVRFSLLLKEIGALMPNGAKLSSLVLSQDTSQAIRLTVDITTAEKAGVLQQNIVESCLFAGADILSVTTGQPGSAYGFAGDLQAYYDPTVPLNILGNDDALAQVCEDDASQTEQAPVQDTPQEPAAPQEETDQEATEPQEVTPEQQTDDDSTHDTSGGAL